ncbi:MAG TPA: amino acid adenylation domain-containing protein [Streptosporangiaceae bacterium]|nr:amino acid adenylation domain-containing protein [Streptosporangiaceae bacterium]
MDPSQNLHQRFRAIARRRPRRLAVRAGDIAVTYGQLDAQSDRLAAALRLRGVRSGDRVGLCCDRGHELIAGMLGILKAGGVYVPIDPCFPDARIQLLVRDSDVQVVLADSAGRSALSRSVSVLDVAVLDIACVASQPAEVSAAVTVSGDSIAYVIYTSGSTGTPKGVQVTHHNVLRLFASTAHWFGFDDTDVWTMFHSPCFDFSVWEIWGALLHGGTLVIVPPEVVGSPAGLLALLAAERVTVLNQTPSAFRLLIAAGFWPATAGLSLRLIIFGGERLDVAILHDWIAVHGDEQPQLVNMYGITETTVHVTYRRIRASDLRRPHRSPIGMPIPDLRVTLRDAEGKVVPAGATGEIWVSGSGVAVGYLNRPALTAERFIELDGVPAYRSGDLGMIDDGELIHCGRLDQQIKVRGYRIEPFEVEAALLSHPRVAAIVVTSADFGDGDVRLIAYVQLKNTAVGVPSDDMPEDQLRQYAARCLPASLRPSEYAIVPRIPLTAQGKVDLRGLREYSSSGAGAVWRGAC